MLKRNKTRLHLHNRSIESKRICSVKSKFRLMPITGFKLLALWKISR